MRNTISAAVIAAGILEAAEFFHRAEAYIRQAKGYADNNQYDVAYREARRALRPLRLLMRSHWMQAVESLDAPTASRYSSKKPQEAIADLVQTIMGLPAGDDRAARPAGLGAVRDQASRLRVVLAHGEAGGPQLSGGHPAADQHREEAAVDRRGAQPLLQPHGLLSR